MIHDHENIGGTLLAHLTAENGKFLSALLEIAYNPDQREYSNDPTKWPRILALDVLRHRGTPRE